MLFSSTGIISAGQMHLYLALFFTGIISSGRMHLYLPLLSHRDYFAPSGCISIFLFCFTGIISTGQMHLYLALLLHRDYFRNFGQPNASLSCSFVTQGLFPPPGFIPSLLFCSTGIISASRMHPCLPLLLHRDYFRRSDSSLSSSFAPQGLFPPVGFIPAFLFCSTGIISAGRIHLYLPLLFHRDYFCRPDSSPACSFLPLGLFRPAECISNPGSCKVSATKLLLHRKHSYGFC